MQQQQSNGGGGGGGHATALDMQRLQQQLQAQYNRAGAGAGSGATHTGQPGGGFAAAANNQTLTPGAAFAMMQQQQQQPLHPSAATNNPGMSGMLHSGMWNSQPQQQQQQPMAGNESSLDASTGSSARLMAMVGMNAPGSLVGGANAVLASNVTLANNPSLSMQNMQALLQQQQQQQLNNQAALTGNFQQAQQQILHQQGKQQNALFPQQQQHQPAMLGGFGGGMNLPQQQQQQQQPPLDPQQQSQQQRATGVTASQQILFQQQFANLQKQIQQGGTTAVAANAAVVALRNAAANLQMQQGSVSQGAAGANPLLRQQQQSMQQQAQQPFYMQQQQPQASDPSAGSSLMNALQRPGPFAGAPTGHGLGVRSVSSQASLNGAPQQQHQAQSQPTTLTEQHLRLHQQQQQALMLQHQQQQRQQQHQPSLGQETAAWQQPQYGTATVQPPQAPQTSLQDSSQQAQASNGSAGAENASTQQQQQGSGNDMLRSYLNGNFVGGWQSNSDLPDRRRVIFQILDVIRMMRPENTKMNDKLPHMAKSLEEHLYRSAPSKEEYLNTNTLKTRLQAIAQGLETHRSTSSSNVISQQGMSYSQQGGSSGFGQQQQQQQQQSLDGSTGYGRTDGQNASWGQSQQQPAFNSQVSTQMQQQQPQYDMLSSQMNAMGQVSQQSQHGAASPAVMATGNSLQQPDTSWANVQKIQQSGAIDTSNSGVGGQQLNQFQQGNYMMQQPVQASGASMNTGGIAQQQQPQLPPDNWGTGQNIGGSGAASDLSNMDRFQETDADQGQKRRVIAQQQQRLLLLRHASKCAAGPACTTRFCPQMVTLWRHMKTCRDKNCRTPHCLSSRCVLNHYRICKSQGKTATCEVCGPVMAKIKQLEREDGSVDPLVGHHESQGQTVAPQQMAAPMAMPAPNAQPPLQQQQPAGQYELSAQLQQQQMQAQIKMRIDQLQQLQKQQNQLQEQQLRLKEQESRIEDPNSQQAYQLHQQQTLLGELQKRCQQQQQLLQSELQQQTGGIAAMNQPSQQSALQHTGSRLTQNLHQGSVQQLQAGLTMAAQLQAQAAVTQPQLEMQSQQMQFAQQPVAQAFFQSAAAEMVDESQPILQSPGNNIIRGKAARRGSGMGKGFANIAASRSDAPKALKKRNSSVGAKERSQKKAKAAAARALAPLSKDLDVSEQSVPPYILPSSSLGSSLITAMTRESITRHLESLNKRIHLSSRTVSHKCLPVIQEMIDDQFGWVFADPVDPVALGLPDYFEVVKNPMHLELVKKKLENAIYADLESFARDTKLVFENAILYNGEESEVGVLARSLLAKFDQLYSGLIQGIASSQQTLESKGEACSLCGTQKRMLQPTILYCRGRCGMQRIKRQDSYVTDRTKQNHWCMNCYELLQPEEPIVLDDGTEVFKKDLQEFKNDAQPEEGWVNCDECNSWIHQICGLFNGRTNKSNAPYTCPNCYLKKVDSGLLDPPLTSVKGASDLPQSALSQAIESGLISALQVAYQSRAKELAIGIEEVEKAEGLSVRVLSNIKKQHFVGSELVPIYESKGCPTSFPFKSKCIALFQTLDGVDTILFSMYVYEYGQDCPAPNRRRVYISYLDSVQYFEPRCYRTIVYQSILVEYLRHMKKRGFHTAHIWSCPPTPGDDYIFYCHPEHQKFPREDMLRAWYNTILEKAKAEGIVIQTTTLYDEYFSSDVVHGASRSVDPTGLPYFEGDYIPGELEKILRTINSQEEAVPDNVESEVMRRLGHNVMKMKDNFIVAYLRSRRFAAAVERGEDVSSWPEDSDDEVVRSKRAKISGKGPATDTTTSAMAPAPMPSIVEAPSLMNAAVIDGSVAKYQDGSLSPTYTSTPTDIVQSALKAGAHRTSLDPAIADDSETTPLETGQSNVKLDDDRAPPEKEASEPLVSESAEVHVTRPDEIGSTMQEADTMPVSTTETEASDSNTMSKKAEVAPEVYDAPSLSATGDIAQKPTNQTASIGENFPTQSSVPVVLDPPGVEGDFDVPDKDIEDADDTKSNDVKEQIDNSSLPAVQIANASIDATESSHPSVPNVGTDTAPITSDNLSAVGDQPMTGGISSAPSALESQATETIALDHEPSSVASEISGSQIDNKRALDEIAPAIKSHFAGEGISHSGQPVGDTSDVDELIESEMFESRQQFLNYCQTNHCQFDEQRRAKHSSIMVLFHLHNPSAPKFLQQCSACYVDIPHGFRYHCNRCPDFDLCQDCYGPVTSGEWAKRDPRFAHDQTHTFTPINMDEETSQVGSAGREERSKALKTHIELLEHAGHCQGAPTCALQNCVRMKGLFEHIGSCTVKPKKDCRTCNRLLSLVAMHSRLCGVHDHCPIPYCDRIRERYKRLRQQQQLMDDRRRQAQNELYHAAES